MRLTGLSQATSALILKSFLQKHMKRKSDNQESKFSLDYYKCPIEGCSFHIVGVNTLKDHLKSIHLLKQPGKSSGKTTVEIPSEEYCRLCTVIDGREVTKCIVCMQYLCDSHSRKLRKCSDHNIDTKEKTVCMSCNSIGHARTTHRDCLSNQTKIKENKTPNQINSTDPFIGSPGLSKNQLQLTIPNYLNFLNNMVLHGSFWMH